MRFFWLSSQRPVFARSLAFGIPLLIVVLLLLPPGTPKNSASSGKVVFETETGEQYARVIEKPDGSRSLELNEGLAVHSVYRPHTVLTGNIWDAPLVLPFAVRSTPPERIAILGNGAGTVARAYGKFFPRTYIDGVEIDSELTEIGRRYFGLKNPRFTVHHNDARPFLRQTRRRYDVIVMDAYRQPYIPFYLTTREFFALARSRLDRTGTLLVNVGHPEDDSALEQTLSATLRTVFRHLKRDPTEPTNTMLIASDSQISADRLVEAAKSFDSELRSVAYDEAAMLAPP